MTGASLAVALLGQALAQARGLVTKHAIKQVDRLLSSGGIDVWESLARWVPHLVGSQTEIVVAMDWTDFDSDDQATLALNLVTILADRGFAYVIRFRGNIHVTDAAGETRTAAPRCITAPPGATAARSRMG